MYVKGYVFEIIYMYLMYGIQLSCYQEILVLKDLLFREVFLLLSIKIKLIQVYQLFERLQC